MQTVQKWLEKALFSHGGEEISNKLQNFLFTNRNKPSIVTGISPAESIFKIRPRTRFDLLKPSRSKKKLPNKSNNVLYKVNDRLFVKNKQSHSRNSL